MRNSRRKGWEEAKTGGGRGGGATRLPRVSASLGEPRRGCRSSLRVAPNAVHSLMSYIRHLSTITAWPAAVCCNGAMPPSPSAADLDTPAFSPLYQQIKALLTKSLEAGEWRPGEAIPSETELAGRFKVSQGTVRKAIDELATENLLVRRQGKGTFVATHEEK